MNDKSSIPPPDWRLPPGVSRGVWEYAHRPHIAGDYDDEFVTNTLFEFDERLLIDRFKRPGVLVDLGCGTGRALVPFARRGFHCVGVDLSPVFLDVVGQKAAAESVSIDRVLANLIELGCLADASVDYGVCLFSTLGMIRGRANRHRVLEHVRRIIRPDGLFVLHVHNRWYNLRESQGRRWLLKNLLWERFRGDREAGDKFFPYRGIREMFLHVYTQSELVRDVQAAGWRIQELIPLDTVRRHALPRPRLFGRFRANGWIAVCGN